VLVWCVCVWCVCVCVLCVCVCVLCVCVWCVCVCVWCVCVCVQLLCDNKGTSRLTTIIIVVLLLLLLLLMLYTATKLYYTQHMAIFRYSQLPQYAHRAVSYSSPIQTSECSNDTVSFGHIL